MKTTLEIEFKTKISEKKYLELIKMFDLEKDIFKQTNHYFDTKKQDIVKNDFILRIRQKGENYKLTSKEHTENGTIERHIKLSNEEAKKMIESGFDASIINLSFKVFKVAELTTYRVKMPYKDGVLFFDKNTYYDTIDFEIEYEANSMIQGEIDFKSFLVEQGIPFVKMKSKTKRAYQMINSI